MSIELHPCLLTAVAAVTRGRSERGVPDVDLEDVLHLGGAAARVELDAHPLHRLGEGDAVVVDRGRLVGVLALHPRVVRGRGSGNHSLESRKRGFMGMELYWV